MAKKQSKDKFWAWLAKSPRVKTFRRWFRRNKRQVVMVSSILLVALVGVGLLILTKALTPTAHFEAEAGTRTNNAQRVDDLAASGRYAVSFGSQQAASGKFYVVGKQIVDPEGNIFIPMGANVGMRHAPGMEYNYTFNHFGTANDKSQQVQAWGWNTIRPNINCAPSSNPSVAQVLEGLDQLVNEYTAKKMVVMITCRVNVGIDYDYNSQAIQASVPMIKTIAQKYKNNPYVWMNTFNEPISSSSQSNWTSLNQSLYNDVRALAPDMMFVADLGGAGNQIESLVDGNLASTFGGGKCNVVYGWHAYGFIGGFADDAKHQSYINQLAAKNIAMVVGEFGDPLLQDGSPFMVRTNPESDGIAGNPVQNRIAANAVLKYAYPAGYGMTWWIATGDKNNQITYSLTKDMTSPWTVNTGNVNTKLAPAGKLFWDLSHQSHIKGRFTGNLANSGCASAQ